MKCMQMVRLCSKTMDLVMGDGGYLFRDSSPVKKKWEMGDRNEKKGKSWRERRVTLIDLSSIIFFFTVFQIF